MHITYNSEFPWYYGTDGATPAGLYDLVSVAAHEIGHGLNFSGSAYYSNGVGSYGALGSPNIFDTFMESGSGVSITSYTNSSTDLGSLLTSNNLWFDGSNANAANGGRVKMYAPGGWSPGSSYAHLDEDTFDYTSSALMTPFVASGSSNHNPGPVTLGLLKDLGWTVGASTFSFSGTVRVGSLTGSPLSGATVSIAGKTATTGADGTFSITAIPGGTYSLTISKAGYLTYTDSSFAIDADVVQSFYLTPVALPNLMPSTPPNWSDKIVVSKITGTNTDSTGLTPTDTLYLDWAVLNDSDASATFSTTLYVDGVARQSWQASDLPPHYYGVVNDFPLGTLPSGTHTLRITADPTNAVVESNESDNSYTKTITVGSATLYSMSGTIRAGSATGPVLSGATVSIAGKSATTGTSGTFSITGIPAGSYTLTISRTGYTTYSNAAYSVGSNQTGLTFYLARQSTGYSMSGTVRSGSATGPLLSGATVSIAGKTAVTGTTGTFSITAIPAGTYTLTISKAGYTTYSNTAYYIGTNQSGLTFYLTPQSSGYSISGTVRSGSATGPLLSGAIVSIAGKSAVTGTTGTFTITAIPSGTYTLTITKSGYTTYSNAAYYVGSNQSGVTFYLTPQSSGYSMSGTVRSGSATGPLLSGAIVSIAGKSAVTGTSGTFTITAIPSGTYTLTISKTGYTTYTNASYYIGSNQSGLVFSLTPASSGSSVRVVNGSTSYGITKLYLSLSSSTTWGANKITTAIPPGGSVTLSVPPGTYDLAAVYADDSTFVRWRFEVTADATTTINAVAGSKLAP